MGFQTVIDDYTIEDAYHILFYQRTNWLQGVKYMGVPISKNPLDLWITQEIVCETRPEVIIETGTWCGGSALYYIDLLERVHTEWVREPIVITIDNGWLEKRLITDGFDRKPDCPVHPGIHYLIGDSADREVFEEAKRLANGDRAMVVLDSCHESEHVAKELALYSDLVSEGCYLIVEDTNVNMVLKGLPPGPTEAIEEFLERDERFVCDREREKFDLSFSKGGWLKKVRQ